MTTHTPATNTELTELLNGPTSIAAGDVISIPAGLWVPTANIAPASGRLAGVTIRGAGRGITRLSGRSWMLIVGGRLVIEDLTCLLSGVGITSFGYGAFDFADGRIDATRVQWTGTNSNGNLVTCVADDSACLALFDQCSISGAHRDCLSTKAPGGAALAAMSFLHIVDSQISDQGVNSNDQCLTPHDGFDLYMDSGSLSSRTAEQNAAAPDATSVLRLEGVAVLRGQIHQDVTGWWNL